MNTFKNNKKVKLHKHLTRKLEPGSSLFLGELNVTNQRKPLSLSIHKYKGKELGVEVSCNFSLFIFNSKVLFLIFHHPPNSHSKTEAKTLLFFPHFSFSHIKTLLLICLTNIKTLKKKIYHYSKHSFILFIKV